MILKNPTIFSVLGLIAVVIGLPLGIYLLTLDGGGNLGGVLILSWLFIVALIITIDRLVVLKVNTRKLNFIESILLLVGVTWVSFSTREIIIDLEQSKTNYFVLIENDGTLENSDLRYSFPFNQKIVHNKKAAVINSIKESYQRLEMKSPRNWNSQRMQPWSVDNYNIIFYSNGNIRFEENDVDTIIKKEIKSVANRVDGSAPE